MLVIKIIVAVSLLISSSYAIGQAIQSRGNTSNDFQYYMISNHYW